MTGVPRGSGQSDALWGGGGSGPCRKEAHGPGRGGRLPALEFKVTSVPHPVPSLTYCFPVKTQPLYHEDHPRVLRNLKRQPDLQSQPESLGVGAEWLPTCTEKLGGADREGVQKLRKGPRVSGAATSTPQQVLLRQLAPHPGAGDKHCPRGGRRAEPQGPGPGPPATPSSTPRSLSRNHSPLADPHEAQGLRRGRGLDTAGWLARAGVERCVQRGAPWPSETGRWVSRVGGSEPHSEGHGGWGPGGTVASATARRDRHTVRARARCAAGAR